jgi:hypothetical protein
MSLKELRLHVGKQSVQLPTFYGCSNHIGEIDIRNAIDRHSVDLHDDRAHEYMLIDIANSGHTSILGWVAAIPSEGYLHIFYFHFLDTLFRDLSRLWQPRNLYRVPIA